MTAQGIRNQLIEQLIGPARAAGRSLIGVRAGDVHDAYPREIWETNRHALVCNVLGGKKLRDQAGIDLVERTGVVEGADVWFSYRLR